MKVISDFEWKCSKDNKENQITQFVSPKNNTNQTKMNESYFDQESSIKTPNKNLLATQESVSVSVSASAS